MTDDIIYHIENEQEEHVDMSYFRPNIGCLSKRSTFKEGGEMVKADQSVYTEDYFQQLYIQFVRIYGVFVFEHFPNIAILRILDRGKDGTIYEVRFEHIDTVYVLKMQTSELSNARSFLRQTKREKRIQEKLAVYGVSLKLIAQEVFVHRSKVHSLLLMERMHADFQYSLKEVFETKQIPAHVFSIIFTKIHTLLRVFCKLNIVHGDMHWKNMYLTYTPTYPHVHMKDWTMNNISIGVIDFGFSIEHSCVPELEIMALGKTIYAPHFTTQTKRKLEEGVVQLLRKFRIPHTVPLQPLLVNQRYNDLYYQFIH